MENDDSVIAALERRNAAQLPGLHGATRVGILTIIEKSGDQA